MIEKSLMRYIGVVFLIMVVMVWWADVGTYGSTNNTLASVGSSLEGTSASAKESEASLDGKAFPKVKIVGQSGYVYDVATGRALYEKNPNSQLPLASITKVMTAYVALLNAPSTYVIDIDQEDLDIEGDFGLYLNDKWSLEELLKFTLVNSANDGAEAIANDVSIYTGVSFTDLMNQEAKNLGLTQTFFTNPTGLDSSENVASVLGSAKDVAVLISKAALRYPDVFIPTTKDSYRAKSLTGLVYEAKNTNTNGSNTLGLRASKTGFTELAGGNLAILVEIAPMRPVAIVVLGSTREERFHDVDKLLSATVMYMGY